MLKSICKRQLYYTYSAVAVLFVFLFVMLGGPSFVARCIFSLYHYAINSCSPNAQKECTNYRQYEGESIWGILTTIGTWLLATFTGVVAVVSLRQIKFLVSADKRAAESVKISRDTERAFLWGAVPLILLILEFSNCMLIIGERRQDC